MCNYTIIAVQYPDNHFAEEFEKNEVETFSLYPPVSGSNKSLLRNIEMIGEEQSETLRRHVNENLASLNHQLEKKLDVLCSSREDDVTEILKKHQRQCQQIYEDQSDNLTEQVKQEIIQLLNQQKQESLHMLERETDTVRKKLEEVIIKHQAESKKMATLYDNSQFETKVHLRVIIIILFIIVLLLIYSTFKA